MIDESDPLEGRPWIHRDATQCSAAREGVDIPPQVSNIPLCLFTPLHSSGVKSERCFDTLSYDDEILREKVLLVDKGVEFPWSP